MTGVDHDLGVREVRREVTSGFEDVYQRETDGKRDGHVDGAHGHEPPEDVNNWTKTSIGILAGQGLIAAARDNYPRDGQSRSFVVGFAEVEGVRAGKYLELRMTASSAAEVSPRVKAMCDQLLANPVIESYRFEVEELAPA